MIPKPIRDITHADLQELIKTPIREGKTIEYKRQLPGGKDEDKREFLADASSFANAIGGDLLYGVEEKEGLPTNLVGVECEDLDAEIQRLDNLLRSGLEPRLPHYDTQFIDLGGKRQVLILRIPRSWSAPHRVTFRDHAKFYARNSSGKYHLDVGELRIAFTASEALGERIRRFREERLGKIVARDTPVPLIDSRPTVVLHTMPLRAFTTRETVDLDQADRVTALVYPAHGNSKTRRINFEGIVGFDPSEQEQRIEYNQLFRSGIIKSVATLEVDDRNKNLNGLRIQCGRGTATGIDVSGAIRRVAPGLCILLLAGGPRYKASPARIWCPLRSTSPEAQRPDPT